MHPLADTAGFTRNGIWNFCWQAHLAWHKPTQYKSISRSQLVLGPHRPTGIAYTFLEHTLPELLDTNELCGSCMLMPQCTSVTPPVITSRLPDSTVSIVTGYGADGWGSIPDRGKRHRPHLGPQASYNRGPWSASGQDVKPTTYSIFRWGQVCWSYTSTPSYLQCVVVS
jgi:hypothetical protein